MKSVAVWMLAPLRKLARFLLGYELEELRVLRERVNHVEHSLWTIGEAQVALRADLDTARKSSVE